jgi:hypothetical protein
VERFARLHNWELVHSWLGADLNQNLGLTPSDWEEFYGELSAAEQQLVDLKREQLSTQPDLTNAEIGKVIGCTPKQVEKRWAKLLALAWKARN